MSDHSRQFPLPLRFDHSASFNNFFVGANALAVAAVRQLLTGQGWVYLHGARSAGVSHLLQAATSEAQALGQEALYLDLAEMPAQARAITELAIADLFDGLEHFNLLCLDNIDAVTGDATWQEALFYLLVKLQSSPRARLLLGAHIPASGLQDVLADLRSRLESATSFALASPDDEGKTEIVRLRAGQLGCEISAEVARFIVQRYSRELTDLVAAVEKLDREALSESRKLTLPFVKRVLGL